jgi:hypothetical protein
LWFFVVLHGRYDSKPSVHISRRRRAAFTDMAYRIFLVIGETYV